MIAYVIRALIQHCSHLVNPVNLAIAPTPLRRRDIEDDRLDQIALTIVLGAQQDWLVDAILEAGVDPWGESNIFGHSIMIATETGDAEVVKLCLSAGDSLEREEISEARKKMQSRVVTNAMNKAAQDGGWEVATVLLTWAYKCLPKPPLSTVGSWIENASKAGRSEFLADLREAGYLQHSLKSYADFIAQGLAANPKPKPMLRHCIREGLLNENGLFERNCSG